MLFSIFICGLAATGNYDFKYDIWGLAAKSAGGEGLFSSHHWFLEEIRTTMVYETVTF